MLHSFTDIIKSLRPPGSGWSPIPGSRRGGWHRRRGKGWEQWYPSGAAASAVKPAKKSGKPKGLLHASGKDLFDAVYAAQGREYGESIGSVKKHGLDIVAKYQDGTVRRLKGWDTRNSSLYEFIAKHGDAEEIALLGGQRPVPLPPRYSGDKRAPMRLVPKWELPLWRREGSKDIEVIKRKLSNAAMESAEEMYEKGIAALVKDVGGKRVVKSEEVGGPMLAYDKSMMAFVKNALQDPSAKIAFEEYCESSEKSVNDDAHGRTWFGLLGFAEQMQGEGHTTLSRDAYAQAYPADVPLPSTREGLESELGVLHRKMTARFGGAEERALLADWESARFQELGRRPSHHALAELLWISSTPDNMRDAMRYGALREMRRTSGDVLQVSVDEEGRIRMSGVSKETLKKIGDTFNDGTPDSVYVPDAEMSSAVVGGRHTLHPEYAHTLEIDTERLTSKRSKVSAVTEELVAAIEAAGVTDVDIKINRIGPPLSTSQPWESDDDGRTWIDAPHSGMMFARLQKACSKKMLTMGANEAMLPLIDERGFGFAKEMVEIAIGAKVNPAGPEIIMSTEAKLSSYLSDPSSFRRPKSVRKKMSEAGAKKLAAKVAKTVEALGDEAVATTTMKLSVYGEFHEGGLTKVHSIPTGGAHHMTAHDKNRKINAAAYVAEHTKALGRTKKAISGVKKKLDRRMREAVFGSPPIDVEGIMEIAGIDGEESHRLVENLKRGRLSYSEQKTLAVRRQAKGKRMDGDALEGRYSFSGMLKNVDTDVMADFAVFNTGRRSRAYCTHDNLISLGSHDAKKTLFHEVGHAIEHQSAGITRAAQALRDERGKTSMKRQLSKIYPHHRYGREEVTHEDEWKNAYTGKFYEHGSTELLSMGCEYLFTDPAGFYNQDPEHFYFTVAALTGKLGKRDKSLKPHWRQG